MARQHDCGQAVASSTNTAGRDELIFPGAPQSIKFASGENPKRVYGGKKTSSFTRAWAL